MVAHRIRRFAMRDLPDEFALVEIDRGDASVRRLQQRQPLRIQSTAARIVGCRAPPRAVAVAAGAGSLARRAGGRLTRPQGRAYARSAALRPAATAPRPAFAPRAARGCGRSATATDGASAPAFSPGPEIYRTPVVARPET